LPALARVIGLIGSTLREIGVLVVVFAPLEAYLREPHPPSAEVEWIMAASFFLIVAGIIIEAGKD
jgi:hypothetical protein